MNKAITDGVLLIGENPSESLHKTSEIYDKVAFAGVGIDTRRPLEGALYVALRGDRFDGNEFVAHAFDAGADGVMLCTCHSDNCQSEIGNRIARLIGAPECTVVMGDTLSVKVYQALASALELRPDRKVILSDSGNFPSDLYMADGLVRSLGQAHDLRIVAPEEVAANITDDLAVLMLTEVDYRTGRRHDMAGLTARAQAAGALTVWDLAHSAGALPVDVAICAAAVSD